MSERERERATAATETNVRETELGAGKQASSQLQKYMSHPLSPTPPPPPPLSEFCVIECSTGRMGWMAHRKGKKLNSTQAQLGQVTCLAVA